MNRRKIAMLSGLLSVAALALAGTASAGWVWYPWGSTVTIGTAGNCFAPVPGKGYSVINGSDNGIVHAFCYDEAAEKYECGTAHGTRFYVQSAARPQSSSTWEYTGATSGQTIGSAAGGPAHYYHACHQGFFQ